MKLSNEDCIEAMGSMVDACVDLTVTSPPYDKLRHYNDSLKWDESIWQQVISELHRITKPGGIVVWVVGDSTVKGSETGTSFKQALFFMSMGFRLHDTMIYRKNTIPKNHNRYEQDFEYMFIFSKGKPKTFNPLKDLCKHHGSKRTGTMRQDGDELTNRNAKGEVKRTKIRGNIWSIMPDHRSKHPAIFPEKLAEDHILSWSNSGDIVFDPFMGSGTTGKMALLNDCDFIGVEKVDEYFNLAKGRIEKSISPLGELF